MANYNPYTDHELVALLRKGDQLAYTEIFNRYNSLLFIHAFKKFPSNEEVKDIIQEVFTMLWNKRESFVLQTNLAGYLYTCIHHKILDLITRQKTATKYVDSLQSFLHEENKSADHLVREKQLSAIIEREIAALPPKMREIFELSRKRHLSHKEIAKQLTISEETVKSQVKNALKILRFKLNLFTFFILLINF
jgi:RNA polymerase sigma-70 factor (ECF subfamily)